MRNILLFSILLLFPATSFAAELRLEQMPTSVGTGDTFVINLVLQTDSETINAIEGSLHVSSAISLVDTRLQGSLVPLWISPPTEKEKGIVSFAGVLPGGYRGEGNVLTLVFSANQKGVARISFGSDTVAYRNDGQGTATKLSLPVLSFPIDASDGTPNIVSLEKDVFPPEPFTPIVSSGEPFGLKGPVLVFTTQDKNSGILRYDISRSFYGNAKEFDLSWSAAQSPYLFFAGDSMQYLYIRAVDRAGNARVVIVPPQNFSPMAFFLGWGPLLLCVVIGAVILGARWRRFLR